VTNPLQKEGAWVQGVFAKSSDTLDDPVKLQIQLPSVSFQLLASLLGLTSTCVIAGCVATVRGAIRWLDCAIADD
jgi:hypothetical protein